MLGIFMEQSTEIHMERYIFATKLNVYYSSAFECHSLGSTHSHALHIKVKGFSLSLFVRMCVGTIDGNLIGAIYSLILLFR